MIECKKTLVKVNRWGGKVFEAEDYDLKWDGTKNGENFAPGVYFYVLEGENYRRSGSVTLLR